ncbi:MAG: tetratricopeptide repeat protein [Bacteroidia bacterium]
MIKHLSIFLVTAILTANTIFAQTTEAEKKELYPDKYTFEKADDFQKKGEYEKAVWFYINLFPENQTRVIEIVKMLAIKLDTIDMGNFIKKSFALYGTFDPTIISFENGAPNMDMGKLKLKGAWGDELIQKISDQNKPLTSASEYNFRGIDKAKAGKFKEAIIDFDKAIELNPTGQIYYNRAYSKSMIGDFVGAINDFDKTIEVKYRLAEAYFERGYCKDQINNSEGAIDDFTKAIELNSEYADAYNNRAFTRLKQKDYKAAIKDFDKAINIKPDFVGAYVNRGFAKKESGDKSGACKDWTTAVNLGYKEATKFLKANCE